MTRFHRHYLARIVPLLSSIALIGCAEAPRSTPHAMDYEQRLYVKSIKDAAARGPGWDVPLAPLRQGPLSVSTFTDDLELDTQTTYVWVAPARDLRQMCTGKSDTVLALQQILGLPPQKNPKPGHQWRVYAFEVDSQNLFRPCPGGVDPAATTDEPRCRLGSDLDPKLDPEFTQFLLQQWWSSHRATVEPGNDPELGYPWTGMGWTYDWDPTSKTHVGVSEFVVKKHSVVSNVRVATPAEFCNSAGPGL